MSHRIRKVGKSGPTPSPLAKHFDGAIRQAFTDRFGMSASVRYDFGGKLKIVSRLDSQPMNNDQVVFLQGFTAAWDAAGDAIFPEKGES